jgi:NTP pyrophosphatase (non-canonical NTP hydrolase)
MNTDLLGKLLSVVDRKNSIDKTTNWSDGSITYLNELKTEIIEVEEELQLERVCYLEDELADVLWDYLNVLKCLEEEKGISSCSVLNRAYVKYNERVTAIENNISWEDIKNEQNNKLSNEHDALLNNV